MASVHDVAAYILAKQSPMSAMKLQKLVYYSQAWHLVWSEQPLFDDEIQAWANGPVVYELFDKHRGKYSVDRWTAGNPAGLTADEASTVDAVLNEYGHLSGRQLSHMTHAEQPWAETRDGLPATAISSRVIPKDLIAAYYSSLDTDEEAVAVHDLDWEHWLEAEGLA